MVTVKTRPKLLTLEEVSEILRCARDTTASLIREGKLKAIRVGSQYRISDDALSNFLKGSR
jgi:excisionase family DNA binding protein